jgi:hypothetical protein
VSERERVLCVRERNIEKEKEKEREILVYLSFAFLGFGVWLVLVVTNTTCYNSTKLLIHLHSPYLSGVFVQGQRMRYGTKEKNMRKGCFWD